MISPHLRIDAFAPDEWLRLRRLFLPEGRAGAPGITPPLVLIVDGHTVKQALRPLAAADAVEVDLATLGYHGPHSLGHARRTTGARVAIAIDLGAIERIARAVDAAVEPRQDQVEQGLIVARALRAELGHGLHVEPEALAKIPVPSYAALQQTLDALLPDERSAGLFVFDERRGPGALYASAIIVKRGGHVTRLTSHHALEITHAGFRAGRHRELLSAMERRIARPHAALFCTREAWREIAGPEVGALARQVALRGAVLDPVPPWLLALTSIGAAAGMAQGAGRLFGRFVPQSIKDTARALTATPFAALGFDPIALYAELQKLL